MYNRPKRSTFVCAAIFDIALVLCSICGCDDSGEGIQGSAGTAYTGGSTGQSGISGSGYSVGSGGTVQPLLDAATAPQSGNGGYSGIASGGTSGADGAAGSMGISGSDGGGDSGETGGTGGQSGSGGSSGADGQAGSASDYSDCEGGSQVDFSLVGWATQNGKTTGGKNGTTVTVSNGVQLAQALKDKEDSSTPLTILVNGTITPSNSSEVKKFDVKRVRDVSIIGVGSGADFNGIGIKITDASNVVIRNLRIFKVLVGDKDAISIEGTADHIWIDHCELYAEYQDVDKDYYDGLLDAKADAQYITYSWNYLHDSWKTGLVGSSESDTFDRKLTMHHNYYRNCHSRLPLFRSGNGHIFNNYYVDVGSTAINSRVNACLLVESNYFSNVLNPWISAYSDVLGAVELICNAVTDGSRFDYSSSDAHEPLDCEAVVPYNYSSVLNHVEQVPSIVMENAGVGKLDDPTEY